MSESYATGSTPGAGTYFCLECGSQLSLLEEDQLPSCPRCESTEYRRDSMFEPMQEHPDTTAEFAVPVQEEAPTWLDRAREELPGEGRFLVARKDDGAIEVFPISSGWTRIGRSMTADVRLDDPSVSRRHALLVSEPGEALRVLDDRSLNGVYVNGDVVEWGRLEDGDELTIGRYHLFALES